MEQVFLLKHYGDYSIFEQCHMTGEERSWVLERINKEIEKKNRAEQSAYSKTSGQSTPNFNKRPGRPN